MIDAIYSEMQEKGDDFNHNLLYTNRQESLVPYIIKILKDYECTGYIKFLDYELITDESKIDADEYELHKYIKKNKSKNTLSGTTGLYDSRYNLLNSRFLITYGEESKEVIMPLLLPKPYKNYYYFINGSKLYPIYQIVENSTYERGGNTVVMKTLRTPISITREYTEMTDVLGNEWKLPTTIIYLSKKLNPLLYFLAKMGLRETIYYLRLDDIISLSDNPPIEDTQVVGFRLSAKLYMVVDKARLENDEYVQIMTTMFKSAFSGRLKETILTKEYWIRKLGAVFTNTAASQIDKGYSVLNSFEVSLDGVTKDSLLLKKRDKENTYALVRWLLMNFGELLMKDNLDIKNKRVRLAEYIAAELAVQVSYNLYRLLGYSNNELSIKNLEGVLNINPMFLIFKIQASPLLRYDNSVNDMSCWNPLRFTFKGFSSMGGTTGRISDEFRRIHPSHVGLLDLNSSSNTDPGVTGVLTPMNKMTGKRFDNDYKEPDKKYQELVDKYIDTVDSPIAKYDIEKETLSAFSEEEGFNKDNIIKTVLELNNLQNNMAHEFLETFKNTDNILVVKKTSANSFKPINRDRLTNADSPFTVIKEYINPITVLVKKPR